MRTIVNTTCVIFVSASHPEKPSSAEHTETDRESNDMGQMSSDTVRFMVPNVFPIDTSLDLRIG